MLNKKEISIAVLLIVTIVCLVAPKIMKPVHVDGICKKCADLKMFETALTSYYLDEGYYPASTNQLLEQFGRGPYLDRVPIDVWGNDYFYSTNNSDTEYKLVSLGRDGKVGGVGDNLDYLFSAKCTCS